MDRRMMRQWWRSLVFRLDYSRWCLVVGYYRDALTAWLPGRFEISPCGKELGAVHHGVQRR